MKQLTERDESPKDGADPQRVASSVSGG
jgi:hypothetical protein